MKKIYIAICFMIIGVTKVFSCSCAGGITIAEEFENSSTVFKATVINKQVSDAGSGSYEYTLKVLQTWKGSTNENVTSFQANSAACGAYFELNATYLFFAHANTNEEISTSSCNLNMPISAITTEIEELNKLSGVTHIKGKKEFEGEISAFPNPSDGIIYIKSKDILGLITIYDAHGRVVLQKEKLVNEAILPELKAGIYLLVVNRNGIRSSQKLQVM